MRGIVIGANFTQLQRPHAKARPVAQAFIHWLVRMAILSTVATVTYANFANSKEHVLGSLLSWKRLVLVGAHGYLSYCYEFAVLRTEYIP
jgi:hypothetical protein